MLDTMSGWGVNGSLMMLLPDQPLPLPTGLPLPESVSSSSSTGLSSGAVAGIVVGSVVGAVALLGVLLLLLLPRRYVIYSYVRGCWECYCLLRPLSACHLLCATACCPVLPPAWEQQVENAPEAFYGVGWC